MNPKKKTHDPHNLLPLYRRLAVFAQPAEEQQVLWLRIHFLLQCCQTVDEAPCPPERLAELLQGKLETLQTRMPLLRHLLSQFPLSAPSVSLPADLLADLCTVYAKPTFPDLGQIYQAIQPPALLKQKGQIFTSREAVGHAFSLLPDPLTGKLLDLACGAGDYLLVAYDKWRAFYAGLGLSAIDSHPRILQDHLFGIDKDPVAVAITLCRLALRCPQSPCLARQILPLNAYHIFEHPLGQQRYQVIVGNPPWGGRISAEEKNWIRRHTTDLSNRNVVNSFAYFLESAVRLLASSGQFSLLVPAAFLNVQSYQPLRRWLLTQVRLSRLHYVPHLFPASYAPALFLSGCKSAPTQDHFVHLHTSTLTWSPWHTSAAPFCKRVRQDDFAKAPQTVYNIHHDPELEPLFAKMREGAFYLRPKRSASRAALTDSAEHACVDFVLGIITGDNKRHITTEPLPPDSAPIYQAGDVEPFTLHPPRHYIHYDKHTLRQAAPERKYQAPEKLLYRFISKQLITAIDRSGSYTLNNTNFLLPVRLPVSLRTLSALLNSRLLNTYYMYHFFTGKVTTTHLCLLPLRVPPAETAQEIDRLVERLEQGRDAEGLRRLNAIIDALYGLGPDEQQWVERMYEHLLQFPFI